LSLSGFGGASLDGLELLVVSNNILQTILIDFHQDLMASMHKDEEEQLNGASLILAWSFMGKLLSKQQENSNAFLSSLIWVIWRSYFQCLFPGSRVGVFHSIVTTFLNRFYLM